jgi:hypothetical protein
MSESNAAVAGVSLFPVPQKRKKYGPYASDQTYRDAHKDQTRTRGANWRDANREHVAAYNKHYNATHRQEQKLYDEMVRETRRYNVPRGTLTAMRQLQNNKCAICKRDAGFERATQLQVDHCHISGQIRALLCINCNTGIGMFKENPTLLKAAILYIQDWQQVLEVLK